MRTIREWGALLALVFFLGAGLAYTHYHDPNSGAKKIRASAIAACNRGKAKAVIFENFARTAAQARRYSAANENARGLNILAENDLASAKQYEAFANQYAALTPTDCTAENPLP